MTKTERRVISAIFISGTPPCPCPHAALFGSLVDDPAALAAEQVGDRERAPLFRLLGDILPLDAAKNPSMFRAVRELLRSSGEVPTVMDPFCGGGSTLLEARRLGLRTVGSDLNPIPVLVTMVLTRYPSLFSDVVTVNPEARQKLALAQPTSTPRASIRSD